MAELSPEQLAEGWIEHDGFMCPVPPDTLVQVMLRSGRIFHAPKLAIDIPRWNHRKKPSAFDIIAYKQDTRK